MAKQKVTTKTTKRFRYSSFRARIDDLRIEPAKNLSKRVHDYVESSHFLASFDHWKDINLSAGFSAFSYEVESIVQTLPQILYHSEKIFNSLIEHIVKYDDKSLQPLLDLLAQFCHDLGPDFLKYYEKAINTLIGLLDAAIKFESTEVFEWGFNCLAYIFKYLSRVLSDDLIPTFDMLLPLLSHPKEYLCRFSAEALSFLVRKANAKNLSKLVAHFFEKLSDEDDDESNLYDGLLTLLTESLISTSESLHSKSKVILNCIIEESFKDEKNVNSFGLLCDIWVNISRHASEEELAPVYLNTMEILELNIDTYSLDSITKLVSTIVFSESGKKVSDWSIIMRIMEKVFVQSTSETLSGSTVGFFSSVMLRNCDIRHMTQFHKKMFEFVLEKYQGEFLQFFNFAQDLSSERLLSFGGVKYLQKFIDLNWRTHAEQISLYILQISENTDLKNKIIVNLPSEFLDFTLKSLQDCTEVTSSDDLYNIYWKILLLGYSTGSNTTELLHVANNILASSFSSDDFSKDVVGHLLMVMSVNDEMELKSFVSQLMLKIPEFKSSIYFIKGFNKLLKSIKNKEIFSDIINANSSMVENLGDNLTFPDASIRYESMNLIGTCFEIQNIEVPRLLQECQIVDQIPLTLQNARDITTRLRGMGETFAKFDPKDPFVDFFFKYLFGLLTVRFSPVWDGIFEIIPSIYNKNPDLVWSLIFNIINNKDYKYNLNYPDPLLEDEGPTVLWDSHIVRLETILGFFKTTFRKYLYQSSTIINLTKEMRGSLDYPPQLRTQALTLLSHIPQLAEKKSKDFVPFIFNDTELEAIPEIEGERELSAATWLESERNMALKILAKFKNIKNIYKSEEVHSRLLNLLGGRSIDVQKLALNALLSFKSPVAIKYRDNLNNLLDDALFKDEMTKFLSNNETRVITDEEESELMTFVLRILYGRAQTSTTSGIKKSRKVAVLTILPNLKERYIIDFFKLGSHGFEYSYFFENGNVINELEVNVNSLRRMTGFITIVNMSLRYLGSKYPKAISTIIYPLLYSISVSYMTSSNEENSDFINKVTSNLRQQSLKCLSTIFEIFGEKINWDEFINNIYSIVIKPRLANFAGENLQQPSSILKLIISWTENPIFYRFLYYDNFAVVDALMNTASNEHAKESVIALILEGSNEIVKTPSTDDQYIDLVALIAGNCLQALPALYRRISSVETMSTAVELLLNMTEAGYIQSNETRKYLVEALLAIIDDKFKGLKSKDTIKILKVLKVLIQDYDCSLVEIEPLYKSLSALYNSFTEKDLRLELNNVFTSMGSRFSEIEPVASLISDLNSYTSKRINEYDFQRILPAFKKFTETQYREFSNLQWLPIIYNSLYFMNDKEELALRTNATHTLKCFIYSINNKESGEDNSDSVRTFKTVFVPAVCNGLKKYADEIQSEYISLVAYVVKNADFYTEIADMKVLLFNGDEEANFFTNIIHIQLHRRQRAIKRLREYSIQLADSSVSHYLIPMIEHYVFSTEEKYRNLGNEALQTIGVLSGRMSWKQYRALVRRYVLWAKIGKEEKLKQSVLLINQISWSLKNTLQSMRGTETESNVLTKLPRDVDEIDKFVKNELYPTLSKILANRNDETIVVRIPLSEALVNFVLGLSYDDVVSSLPGTLTKICQILRSRTGELREAVRVTLAKIATNVGPHYLSFIIRELKSALQRGSQVHVLGYTVHHILRSLDDTLKQGDLDESAAMLVSVIMEDIFGSTGQEKESDNYHTKMVEVKVNRSFDTGEVLASNISLPVFNELLRPIRALLLERINLKTQKKLEELLRRYALGLNHNEACLSIDVLSLCHEIFEQSQDEKFTRSKFKNKVKEVDEKEEFFLVNLNAKNGIVKVESSLFSSVMQKFSLDLLRTVLTKNAVLLNVSNLEGFIPILKEALLSDNEGVLTSALRVLIILIKLDFSEESEAIFKNCARKVLNLIKDSPSTSNELCQMGIKFLSSLIRHKSIKLKDTALSYVLSRILPDLNEPSKQGLAFNFLKALVSKHIMLPEIYDIVNSVREIMITNHSREIRIVSRTVYYQFLMEYDQSKGRLEKQFKYMVDNLQYPSPEGRQSVMELVNLIITKASPGLLTKLSSSFFISLANVSFNDDAGKCREMAAILLSHMFKVSDQNSLNDIEKYITAWLKQSDESTFLNLGLRIYKIYLSSLGVAKNTSLDELAKGRIEVVLSNTEIGSDTKWDLIYSALNVYSTLLEKSEKEYELSSKDQWKNIASCLLYPHTWVRQASARLINDLINNLDKTGDKFSDEEIQNIVSRVLHQLAAPSISEGLSSISIKTLVKVAMIWNEKDTKYYSNNNDEAETEDTQPKYLNAIDFMISRIGRTIRSEENPNDSFMSKKSGIQLFALIVQTLSAEQVQQESEKIILALYMYLETDRGYFTEEQQELSTLSQECLQMLESKMSVNAFTEAYTSVRQIVIQRRQERRAKRSILTVNAPDIAAQKKLRKHARSREKRKHEKDENGFYQRKNKQRRS